MPQKEKWDPEMAEFQPQKKRFILASDFDQTLSFNDSGYVLGELLGIPSSEYERKITGMAKLNLVQQGGELAYLLLHDPEFRKVRREHLVRSGQARTAEAEHRCVVRIPVERSRRVSLRLLCDLGRAGGNHPLGAGGHYSSRPHLRHGV